jgi:D-amino-acid dehydrogenase
MLTPDAPLYLKPRFDPALWGWLLGFASRCNRGAMMRSGAARAALLQASRAAFPDWLASHRIECEFVQDGTDHVFRDGRALEAFRPELEALAELGIRSEIIDGPAYLRDEPALRDGVAGVVRFPDDASLRPDRYVSGLARALRDAGGDIVEHCEVRAISETGDGLRIATSSGEHRCGEAVLAVGAWSPRLARALHVPLLGRVMQPGKGYSITYDRPTLAPRRPLTLQERSVCVSIWGSGYRLGSTMEFSGFDTTLNPRRLAALERAAREYLHEGVGPVKHEEWFGWRPMTVDDMPVIGRVPGSKRQWLATGHGMLGVSMSVGTAQLVGDLVTGASPAIDPAPYRLERFA